jgi:hypothetical protein
MLFGLITKGASVLDYKRDEVAAIELLVGVLVSVIFYGFFQSGTILEYNIHINNVLLAKKNAAT